MRQDAQAISRAPMALNTVAPLAGQLCSLITPQTNCQVHGSPERALEALAGGSRSPRRVKETHGQRRYCAELMGSVLETPGAKMLEDVLTVVSHWTVASHSASKVLWLQMAAQIFCGRHGTESLRTQMSAQM